MSLTPGTRLGPYEILATLGAGGMGEVYRARDTHLNRDVALKVLLDSVVGDPEHVARFTREAHVLASLNHPHIAHLYGFEAGPPTSFLVMELVEGPTLAEAIARAGGPEGPPLRTALPASADARSRGPSGPRMALNDVLAIARQIADALEAAHEQGIIHRDLKPANIKVRDDGVVKVLDFGLARTLDPGPGTLDAANSPTMTARATQMGMILGTAAYMAPEQAKGRPVDKRADIWAFGVVLHEMLTGRQLFDAEDVSETLAAVLTRDVNVTPLPDTVPARLRALVRECLVRDPKQRLRDIGDARHVLDKMIAGAPDDVTAPASVAAAVVPMWRRALPWSMVGVTSVALVVVLALWAPWRAPLTPASLHVSLTLPASQPLSRSDAGEAHPSLALSPDGTRLVYVADLNGTAMLVVRDLTQSEASPIPGTEGGSNPFFSPDGRWIGFFAVGKLKKVALSGGAPTILAEFPTLRGASWGSDGAIIVSPGLYSGLVRLQGAEPGLLQPLTTLDAKAGERAHRWPDVLPGARAVLYAVGMGGSFDDARIVAQTLDGKIRNTIIEGGTCPRYVPTGHIVYAHAGSLWAVPFDAVRLERRGTPFKVLDGVDTESTGAAQFAFSESGTLLAATGGVGSAPDTIARVNRSGGAVETIVSTPRHYGDLELSPNGQRLAVAADVREVLIVDLIGGRTLTLFSGLRTNTVAWMSDATVTFNVEKTEGWNLFSKRVDGGEAEKELLPAGPSRFGAAWTRDGKSMVFTVLDPKKGSDLWVVEAGETTARELLATPANEANPRLAPNGRFFAYVVGGASGVRQVFVRPFPQGDRQWPVSVQSGTDPVWSRDGTELFYREGRRLMGVKVRYSPSFEVGPAYVVLDEVYAPYDVDLDGKRFVMVRPVAAQGAITRLDVITNWFAELTQRMGAGR